MSWLGLLAARHIVLVLGPRRPPFRSGKQLSRRVRSPASLPDAQQGTHMTRALILGGGGPVGIAWETGLIAGLAEEGVDVASADFIMGTSAGSYVGSQLAMGRSASDMAGAIVAEAERGRSV